MNTMYLNKVKSKLAAVSAHYEQCPSPGSSADGGDRHSGERPAVLMALFKSLGMWLEDPVVRDANVHVSSLAPIYMPKKLSEVISGGCTQVRECENLPRVLNYLMYVYHLLQAGVHLCRGKYHLLQVSVTPVTGVVQVKFYMVYSSLIS